MNWGGFAGGFAQGLNQTFDVKGLTRYMLSPEYQDRKDWADSMEQAKAPEVTQSPVQQTATQVPTTTPLPDAPATAAAPEQQASQPMKPGDGIKAVVASETAPSNPQGAEPSLSPQPMSQQAVALNGGVAATQTVEQAKQVQPEQKGPTPIESQLQRAMSIQREKYAAKGDFEKVAKFDAYMDSEKGKKAAALFGKAWNTLTVGNDVKKGVQQFGEYYNKHVDDGVDFTKGEITKDGQIAITTKNKADGAENTMTLSRGQLLRMGMAYNPVKLYEMNLSEAVDAEKQAAKTRGEIAKEDRKFNQEIEKMTIEKQLDAANASAKTKAEVSSKVAALRESGYSNEFINGVMPEILGVGKYKKDASPEEARRILHGWRMDRDTMYARKTPEQQREIISKDMENIYGPAKKSDAQPTPAQPTKPAAGLPSPVSGKGMPVWDTKLGKMVYQ